jgi:hypothetical protein
VRHKERWIAKLSSEADIIDGLVIKDNTGTGYKLELNSIHVDEATGFTTKVFENIEEDKIHVRIGGVDISMDVDGEGDDESILEDVAINELIIRLKPTEDSLFQEGIVPTLN